MDKGYLSPTQPQPPHSASCLCIARRSLVPHTISTLILHHVYVLRDAVSYPTPSAPSFSIMSMYCETQSRTPHHQHRPRTVTNVPTPSPPPLVSPMLRLPSQPPPPPRSLTFFPFFPPFPSVPIHLITLSAIRVSSHCTRSLAVFSRASATPVRLQAQRFLREAHSHSVAILQDSSLRNTQESRRTTVQRLSCYEKPHQRMMDETPINTGFEGTGIFVILRSQKTPRGVEARH